MLRYISLVRTDIADLGDPTAQILQSLFQPGHAIGVRSHAAPLTTFTHVHRSAHQNYVLVIHMVYLIVRSDLRKDIKMFKMKPINTK